MRRATVRLIGGEISPEVKAVRTETDQGHRWCSNSVSVIVIVSDPSRRLSLPPATPDPPPWNQVIGGRVFYAGQCSYPRDAGEAAAPRHLEDALHPTIGWGSQRKRRAVGSVGTSRIGAAEWCQRRNQTKE